MRCYTCHLVVCIREHVCECGGGSYVCVVSPCVQTCLCVFKGARTITPIRTIAFVHTMCVLCVYLCIPVHTCVVHACAWALTGYNVLQCYKKTGTVQPCEYILCCGYSNSCAVVTGVTALCINMDVWQRVKHPAAPAGIALLPLQPRKPIALHTYNISTHAQTVVHGYHCSYYMPKTFVSQTVLACF